MLENVMTVKHPLESLTVDEIRNATSILREQKGVRDSYRFANVTLLEPSKEVVLNFNEGDPIKREVLFILLDSAVAKTYEAIVSLNQEKVTSWKYIPDVQPNILLEEFAECEDLVKKHPDMQAAYRKRGLENFDHIKVDPWSAGNFGHKEEEGVRLVRAISFYKKSKFDNGYARPISGLVAYVDLNKMEVIEVVDSEAYPLPPLDGNYNAASIEKFRDDIKPLDITQPEGPSFQVDGHQIDWQKWKIRFGFNAREGLVLHTVSYHDKGEDRPILYRASLSEMVVPYGDPTSHVNRNNAFDTGEYGIGMLANSLELGCDCLGEIRYFDGVLSDGEGNPVVIKNAVCLHEEDDGILWKHTDWATKEVEVRRSRRLVLSSISTIGNYEYGFFWYFYQDGTIDYEVKLTGILHTTATHPDQNPKYGNLIAPQLSAPHHQHFFNVRLDMMVDGVNNSVFEVNTERDAEGPHNPYKNGYVVKSSLLKTESEAQRKLNIESARYWKVLNSQKKNIVGEPVGYKLMTGENCLPFAAEDSSIMKRAGFTKNHLWVTPYHPDEKYAAGEYINQHKGDEGLEKWTKANRSTENTDVVVWYTMGHHHVTRPEDWPVMPVAKMGFSLKPLGFFDRNPALDVPPSEPKGGSHCSHH